jgi:hypothetical protein
LAKFHLVSWVKKSPRAKSDIRQPTLVEVLVAGADV